ncbi:MAG: type II restriction endonuclease [Acidobacteriaceae bacterium]
MASPDCEAAIEVAQTSGNALLKFISPNDVGITGTHQRGFYLPKKDGVWQLFTTQPPTRGEFDKRLVIIDWQIEAYRTKSAITWYGEKTRSEYRLTRFGPHFPFLTRDSVGDLFVLVPLNQDSFRAFLLDLPDDIEEVQAALGVRFGQGWAIYQNGAPLEETEDECIERQFRAFVEQLTAFPTGELFSAAARRAVEDCMREFARQDLDSTLLKLMECEYRLFRLAERALCTQEVQRVFANVDDFLKTASTIMNRRKSRAGRSLENHVGALLVRLRNPTRHATGRNRRRTGCCHPRCRCLPRSRVANRTFICSGRENNLQRSLAAGAQ